MLWRTSNRILAVCGVVMLWAVSVDLPTAWGQDIFSLDFSSPPNGEYSARGQGRNAAGTAYWDLASNIFIPAPETVSAANGWQVIGDTSPFPQISLVGDISWTTYVATEAMQPLSGPAIIGIDTGGALRANPFNQTTAPARRVALIADDNRISADLTSDYLQLLDAAVDWASAGAGNQTIGFVTGDGILGDDDFDTFWTDRLTSQGHTIISIADDDDPNVAAPSATMFIVSNDTSSGTVSAGGKYTTLAKPLINYESAAYDEFGISNSGSNTTDFGSIQIADPAHPLAGGLTGEVVISDPEQGAFQLPGSDVAPGGTVVADFQTTIVGVPTINTLADADQLRSGELPSDVFTGTIAQADIWDSGGTGRWSFDNFVTNVEENDFAVFSTGTLNVTEQRVYHFAISGDDGGRLRIDQNGDGILDASDDVIVDDTTHGVEDRFGSVQLSVGQHAFEWVGFERGGGAGWEFSVALDPAQDPNDPPFTGQDGDFFAGADMDAGFSGGASAGNPRRIETRPINVAGGSDLRVSVDLAASVAEPLPAQWEDVDFLRVLVDPDADGPEAPIQLIEFRGGGVDEVLTDGMSVLDETFQNFELPLTGVIPANAQQISLIVETLSTAGNEQVGIENLALLGVVPPSGLVGDYNGDGTVNAADYVVFRNNLGQDASVFAPGTRDPANTGVVGPGDYDSWVAHFGETAPGGNAVPEPMTAWLIASGLSLLLLGPHRRR